MLEILLYIHSISLANQPLILRASAVPSSPKHAPSQLRSLSAMRLLPGELSRPQQWDGGAPVSLGSLLPSLPPPTPALPVQDFHCGLQLQPDSWNAAKTINAAAFKNDSNRIFFSCTPAPPDAPGRARLPRARQAPALTRPFIFSGPSGLFTAGPCSSSSQERRGRVPGKRDPSTPTSLFASLLFTPVLSQEFLLKVFGKHW